MIKGANLGTLRNLYRTLFLKVLYTYLLHTFFWLFLRFFKPILTESFIFFNFNFDVSFLVFHFREVGQWAYIFFTLLIYFSSTSFLIWCIYFSNIFFLLLLDFKGNFLREVIFAFIFYNFLWFDKCFIDFEPEVVFFFLRDSFYFLCNSNSSS